MEGPVIVCADNLIKRLFIQHSATDTTIGKVYKDGPCELLIRRSIENYELFSLRVEKNPSRDHLLSCGGFKSFYRVYLWIRPYHQLYMAVCFLVPCKKCTVAHT